MFDWQEETERCTRANGKFGEWWISAKEKTAHADYTLPMEEGETYQTVRDQLPKEAKDIDWCDPVTARLWAKLSSQRDIFYAANSDLVKELINRLYQPAPSEDVLTILTNAGFKKKYNSWSIRLPKGHISFTLNDSNFHVTFEEKGATRWWNLLRVGTERGDNKRPVFFPADADADTVFKIAAQFTVDHLIAYASEAAFLPARPKAKRGQKLLNLMDINKKVDEHLVSIGKNESRDYTRYFGFDSKTFAVTAGIPEDRYNAWRQTSPLDMSIQDKQISDATNAALIEYQNAHPYQDFWHFFLDVFPDLENDQNLEVEFQRLVDEAEEDWQKEIGQVYVDLFGGQKQVVKVCW